MDGMPKAQPPYLTKEFLRGKLCWYVRRGRGKRVRLRAEYGTDAFWAEYRAALEKGSAASKPKARTGTVAWLWERYHETGAWTALSEATRKQRENIMGHVLDTIGAKPCESILRLHIVASRDRRATTPSQARNFLDTMRGLFRWASEAGHVSVDPTAGVKNPARPSTGGFPMWTEEDVDLYQARWPLGTKERVWIDVLLYTGLRRGDAVKLGRQHLRDGIAKIRTQKTGTDVTIPILTVLAETLAAGPCGDLAFICGETGKPLTKESFGNQFRAACRAAGIRKSAHGLRKAGATRAAENGATVAELNAIFGWTGSAMASRYTTGADRGRLARQAMRKLERTSAEQNPPSHGNIGALTSKKAKQ